MPPKSTDQQKPSQPELESQDPQTNAPSQPELESAGGNLVYGNKDGGKQHAFPKSWADAGKVVVHQCNIEQMGTGVVEVPGTHMLQTYSPEDYDRYAGVDKPGERSFFTESKMKVVVLHDPRG